MGAGAAAGSVRTARALFRGPLAATGRALTDGEVSVAHARVLADGTHDLPDHLTTEVEPVLLEAAGRLAAALAVLPPVLGGASTQPLEVGRASRGCHPGPADGPGRAGWGLWLPGL